MSRRCLPSSAIGRRQGRQGATRSGRPVRRLIGPEGLEDRTLLASAVLSISSTGLLSYDASLGVQNALTVSYTAANSVSGTAASYTFSDSGETIALGSGTMHWTGGGTNTVTGPATSVKSITIDTLDGNDSVAIKSVAAPTSVDFTNSAGNSDAVTLGGAANGAQGIGGDLTIDNSSGTTALTVDDSNNTTAKTVFLSDGEIANLTPYLIQFGSANLSSLSILSGSAPDTLNLNANDQGPVAVTAGTTTGSGVIKVGSNAPISYNNFLAVNISNAADQPLTQVSQTITTSTGDTPTEGKSFTFLATTFADNDLQAKTTSFVASINWGDGSPSIAGSLTAVGAGVFQVSGTHTYLEAGSYPVIVAVTDLGTTDSLSIAGIAVTISDLGGQGLTSGSVAQVDLVSSGESPAPITDANLINPWGSAVDANGLAWVANEGSGVATYEGPGGSLPEGTAVVIPPAKGSGIGSPTGIVYNNTSGFSLGGHTTEFLYATLDGTISAWDGLFPNPGPPVAVIAVNNNSQGAIYTGLAIAQVGNEPMLYAANFASGQVEAYNSQFQLKFEFTDANWPNGYAPYNVQNIGGNLYVSFAKQNQTKTAPVAGLGNGFIDEFTPSGTLVTRLITGAPLDAPWGLALAPASLGQFSNDLLVANHGNGEVDAFDPTTGQFVGAFADATGAPLVNDGLHGLVVGAGGSLYFTAGPLLGTAGVFGSLDPSPDTVTIAAATLAAAVTNVTAFVNQPFDGVVATFTDANIYALPSEFTATINWGDGSSDTSGDGNLTIVHVDGIGSSFLVQGMHTYAQSTAGYPPDIVTITITDTNSGNSVFAQGTASVSDPTLHVTVSSIAAIVNLPYEGPVATFTDDAPDTNVSDYSATIDWGDGTSTEGTITLANQGGQSFIVTDGGSPPHFYETASTGQAPYVVTVSVDKSTTDPLGAPVTESGSAAANVTVTEPTIHASFSSFAAFVDQPYPGAIATFTDDAPDPDIDDYTATIDWGDGSESTGIITPSNQAGQSFVVTDGGDDGELHSYDAATTGQNPYVVTVTIEKSSTDTQGYDLTESGLAVGTVAVSLPTLHATFSSYAAVAGASYSGPIATFTDDLPDEDLENDPDGDPNAYYTATIDWGDGTTSMGDIKQSTSAAGSFIVDATQTYMTPTVGTSPFVVSIEIDKTGDSEYATVEGNESVADSLLFPFAQNVALPAAMEGSTTGNIVVAMFTDDNSFVTPANFNGPSASQTVISWGDGKSSVGTIATDPTTAGVFDVMGSHTYASPTPTGVPNTVSIAVLDQWGGKTTITNSIVVGAATVTVNFPPFDISRNPGTGLPIVTNQAFTVDVATFTSSSADAVASEYTATINWGDGTPNDAGTIKEDGNATFHVSGTHAYSTTGRFTVMVTIQVLGAPVAGGGPVTTSFITVVAPPAPPAPAPPNNVNGLPKAAGDFITAGQSFTTPVADFEVSDSTETASTFSASIDWGDGDDDTDLTAGTIIQGANDPSTGDPTFFVIGTHTYDSAGTYEFTVYVSVPGSSSVASDPTEAVAYAPTLIAQPAPIAGVQGEPLPDGTIVATFTDPEFMSDPASFAAATTATVNWGDGTEPDDAEVLFDGTSPTGTSFAVYDTHDYENITDVFQAYQVSVTILTPDGSAAVVNDLAQLTVPVLTDPALAVRAVAGAAFTTPVATIHTTNSGTTAADFLGTIAWGDGQSSSVSLEPEGGGTFEVFGSHTYTSTGTFPISITLSDQNGNRVSDSSTATVTPPPPPGTVSVAAVQSATNRRNDVTQISLTFAGPVDALLAAEPATYRILTAGKGGSFTGRGVHVIRVRSVAFDAVADQVILTPARRISLSKPLELEVGGQVRSILSPAAGKAGGSSVRAQVKVAPRQAHQSTATPQAAMPHVTRADRSSHVDLLLERDELAGAARRHRDIRG